MTWQQTDVTSVTMHYSLCSMYEMAVLRWV